MWSHLLSQLSHNHDPWNNKLVNGNYKTWITLDADYIYNDNINYDNINHDNINHDNINHDNINYDNINYNNIKRLLSKLIINYSEKLFAFALLWPILMANKQKARPFYITRNTIFNFKTV